MPVHRTTVTKGGKTVPAYQYGGHGAKYTYKAGNKASALAAKKKAIAQGLAITRRTGETFKG